MDCCPALNGLGRGGHRLRRNPAARRRGHGTHYASVLLCAVTHHFFERLGVVGQLDYQARGGIGRQHLLPYTDHRANRRRC